MPEGLASKIGGDQSTSRIKVQLAASLLLMLLAAAAVDAQILQSVSHTSPRRYNSQVGSFAKCFRADAFYLSWREIASG